jgi:hypothetical protein
MDREVVRTRLESAWIIAAFAALLLLAMGWRFLADPSLSAPTRDPAWYTWRAQVILDDQPGLVAGEWGPFVDADPTDDKEGTALLSGGYRITTPLSGALLQRVAGIDTYTFSAFLMLGIPILTGLAFAAGAYRSRKHWLVVPLSMLAAAAFFLTTPYVGYLDNITVLFLLSLTFPFLARARTEWGSRVALFLIGIAAAFTHPTTCVLFGLTMMGVFGFHFLTARFRLSRALQSDGPALMSVGFGMIAGLACWVIGFWGVAGNLNDAALPPPYTKKFFAERLGDWVLSLQPAVTVPLALFAIVSTILLARRTRTPADAYDMHAAWWLFPFVGVATVFTGSDFDVAGDVATVVPYYRFMNASAAPMALVGLGAFAAILWFSRPERPDTRAASIAGALLVAWSAGWYLLGDLEGGAKWAALAFGVLGLLVIARPFVEGQGRRVVAGLAALAVVGSLAWMFVYGLRPANWVSEATQWANQEVRSSLVAVGQVAAAAGERPNVLVMNYNDTDDPATRTNTAYGWAKTYTNVFRTGLPGASAKYSVTYLGTIEQFLAGERTTGASGGYDRASSEHFAEMERRFATYDEDPLVFVIGQYYNGRCNGGACAEDDPATPDVNERAESEEANWQAGLQAGNAIEVGPDVFVLTGDGLWTPPADVVDAAHAAATAEEARFADHPAAWANPLHTLRVLACLFLLVVLPGLLARRFFGIDDSGVARVALIPGISIVMTLLSGIVVLAVWRGPLTTVKGFAVVAVSVGLGALLGFAGERVVAPLRSFAGFFDKLFSQFANPDFSVLMGMQFLAQAGQGVVQGAIAKSLAFGGEEGFDVQNLPSARYLLTVVLLLYGPYTLLSPFIGVCIDRFPRRAVVWISTLVAAAVVAAVAVFAMAPLGDATTEGDAFATGALILGLLAVQAVVRVVLAVKSAAIPDVLVGKDLLQGNSLSQAGGGFFQLVGIAVGGVAAAIVPPFLAVLVGAAVVVTAGIVARRLHHAEATARETSFGQELARVFGTIIAGIREVAGRAPAAMGLTSFQMLRYQFWGFNAFTFGLYAKNLVQTGDAQGLSLAISGAGGLLGAGLGIVVAQKAKDRVPPSRLVIVAMVVMGAGTVIGGLLVSVAGFAVMLFTGFFAFFLGKVSADTIVQQAMPDDFRGRAFALFDIAYNVGFIVPAFILFLVWSDSEAAVRTVLLVSGGVFLGLTALIAAWIRRIHDQLAPQDDLVTVPDVSPTSSA